MYQKVKTYKGWEIELEVEDGTFYATRSGTTEKKSAKKLENLHQQIDRETRASARKKLNLPVVITDRYGKIISEDAVLVGYHASQNKVRFRQSPEGSVKDLRRDCHLLLVPHPQLIPELAKRAEEIASLRAELEKAEGELAQLREPLLLSLSPYRVRPENVDVMEAQVRREYEQIQDNLEATYNEAHKRLETWKQKREGK